MSELGPLATNELCPPARTPFQHIHKPNPTREAVPPLALQEHYSTLIYPIVEGAWLHSHLEHLTDLKVLYGTH